MIDVLELDALKVKDLPGMLGNFTTLKRATGREFCGPCPSCGGVDRFHVGRERDGARWWWFCRQCHPASGDVVEFARWLFGYDFAQAVAWARGGLATAVPSTPRTPAQAVTVATRRAWDATQVEHKIDAACRALVSDTDLGRAARAYVARRGLTLATCERFFVGALVAHDSKLHHERPALSLPWCNADVVHGVRYRFFDVPPGGQKITSESGSTFAGGVFGRNAFSAHYGTVVVTEGELNAMSVVQVARAHGWAIDAVSVGSESGLPVQCLREIASDFAHMVVWFDKPAIAAGARDAVPGAVALRSPVVDGVELDANKLLQRGMLATILAQAFARLGIDGTSG